MRKTKTIPPTVEEFLRYKPKRGDFTWKADERGKVTVIVPKFYGTWGRRFVRLLHKPSVFTANLDPIGSVIWMESTGERTVEEILLTLQERFPLEPNLDQRLFLFLQQMKSLSYLWF
jgi:hypothetical protein